MSTDPNRSAAFYCPVHQVRFHATPEDVIQCERASHAIGYGFPHKSPWTFCCACSTFVPYDIASHTAQLTECLVCERQVGKRCLCQSCKVITIESAAVVHRKTHSINDGGVKPFCPGCGIEPSKSAFQHDCPELRVTFRTARRTCEFCGLRTSPDRERQETVGEVLCEFCGVALVAPFRFCKRCGKAPLQAETEVLEPEFPDDDPTDPDPIEKFDEDSTTSEPAARKASGWNYSAAPVPAKRRNARAIAGVVAGLFVTILIVGLMGNSKRNVKSSVPESAMPQSPPGMVYIAGGEFLMGSNNGDEYERPAHKVSVGPFYLDITEVTCEEYLRFLKEKGRRDPAHWTKQTCAPGAGKQPVSGIDWNDAVAYAEWANKRLPTEKEWEFAARGLTGTTYPWGNEWRSNASNAGQSNAQRVMDVGSFPSGRTTAGVMDLIGNVWEWTSSEVVAYPGGSLAAPIPNDVRVVRGGSWRESSQQATGTYRGYLHTTNAEDYSVTGFRCAQDVRPTQARDSNAKN
jgi:formylglycine-generating enzyme required for sulfatase activity